MDYLSKISGKPIRRQEMLITWAADAAVIFISYMGSLHLPGSLIIPNSLGNYFAINQILSHVLPAVFHYLNFNNTDEANLSLFLDGIADLISFVFPTCLLRNCIGICVFLYGLAFNVASVTILAATISTIALWMSLPDGGWKSRGKSYVWKKASVVLRHMVAAVMSSADKFSSFLRMSVDIFNQYDSCVIGKRSLGMPAKQQYEYQPFQGSREV